MALRIKGKTPKPGTRELPPRDRTRKADRELYDRIVKTLPADAEEALSISDLAAKVGKPKGDVLAATLTAGQVRMHFATTSDAKWYRPA